VAPSANFEFLRTLLAEEVADKLPLDFRFVGKPLLRAIQHNIGNKTVVDYALEITNFSFQCKKNRIVLILRLTK